MAGDAASTGNRTTNDGTWTYTFDDAGNEIKKSKGASAETWNYRYADSTLLASLSQLRAHAQIPLPSMFASSSHHFDLFPRLFA